MSNTVQKIQAPTTTGNPYGLMATPAVDLTPTGHLPYLVAQQDTAREHPEHVETLMSALVTALPEFELNGPELLYAVFDPDFDETVISLNSQGSGQLFTPDQADDFADKVIVWGQTVKAMAAAAREHVEAEDTDGCGINLDTMTAAVHESMQKAVPDYYTPERAEAFAACMVAELRAPSAERRGASPLAGLSIVTALISGVQVPIACPAAWCTENHTGEDTKHLEDVNHIGAPADLYAPNFKGRADDLFAYAHLTQDPYSKNPKERAAHIHVEDGGGEESPLTPDQADTFADNLTVFADQVRTLAQTARATGEPATESGPAATPAAGIIAQIHANADAANKAGLGGPAMDAFNAEVIRLVSESPDPEATVGELAQLLNREPVRTTSCRLFPAWCIETGPHYDHVSADVKVIDTEGEEVIDARVLYLSDSTPTVCIGQSDFTADQARMKAAELRCLADRIDELSGHVDQAHAPRA